MMPPPEAKCELRRIHLPRTPLNKPYLINLDQHIAQYVSCQELPKQVPSRCSTERPFGKEVAMSAQQAPHTPLWRQVLSLPHTLLGWWAIGLAAPASAWIVFTNVSEILGWTFPFPEWVGAAIGLTAF